MTHFDAYLRYSDVLKLSSAVPAGRGICGRGCARCAVSQKNFDYTNKLIIIMTTWKDRSITSNTSK